MIYKFTYLLNLLTYESMYSAQAQIVRNTE